MKREFKCLVEIGAGDAESSMALPLAARAERLELFEPNPILFRSLYEATVGMNGVQTYRAAVGPDKGNGQLCCLGYASYLVGAPSFFATSIEPEGESFMRPLYLPVEVVAAVQAIPEECDLLILTPNGIELPILQSMTARPEKILTKHYCHTAGQFEQAREIQQWFHSNGYGAHLLDRNTHGTYTAMYWVKA